MEMRFSKGPAAFVLLAVGACSGGTSTTSGPDPSGVGPTGLVVGARCAKDAECTYRCENDSCTKPCAGDVDCPAGTACISADGGKCAIVCASAPDCSSIGSAYVCKETSRQTGGGKVMACRQP